MSKDERASLAYAITTVKTIIIETYVEQTKGLFFA